MRTIFFGRREGQSGPLGWSPETRGVAVVLAVLAGAGLACGGIEALGFPLHFADWSDAKLVAVDGLVGPARMWLLGGALTLLVVWTDLALPRGRRADRAVSAIADWVLFAAAMLTVAGVWRLALEGLRTLDSHPGL